MELTVNYRLRGQPDAVVPRRDPRSRRKGPTPPYLVTFGGAPNEPADYMNLLAWREERLVATLGARLRHRISNGMDSAVAFGEVQNHDIRAARAHVEHLVADRFVSVVNEMDAGPERDALATLCDLHALTTLEADLGWFMEHSKLSATAAKQLRKIIGELSADARAVARSLVDAFAIPDAILGAEELISSRGQTSLTA